MNLLHKLYYGTASKPDPKQQQQLKKQLNTSVVLPGHIGSRILDLQLEMEAKNMTKESAQELLGLYSVQKNAMKEAVQFYEARQDPKHRTYQHRIQLFLANRDIYSMMFGEQRPIKLKEKDLEEQTVDAEKNARQQVKNLLQNFKKEQQRQAQLINKDVEWQNQRINERIRRRSQLTKSSFSSFSTFAGTTENQPELERAKEI